MIGCAVGYELARRGLDVRIFDSRSVGAGATQASAGMLVPYLEAHERGPLFDMTVRSLDLYDRFVKAVESDSGLSVEYRRCGSLQIALDLASADAQKHEAERLGGGTAQWLDADAARLAEPHLPSAALGALLVPAHGYVAVGALTEALSWAAMRHGATIENHHRIARIEPSGDVLRVTASDGNAWTASRVVAAAGTWLGQLELPDAAAGEVRPVRGQMLRLKWIGGPPEHVIWGPECYLVPWLDGTVLVGATVEDVGFDERTTAAGVRDLLDAACELLPEAWRATFVEARVGLRPATPDGLPIIGSSPSVPGLVYASGHYRNGVLLAPLTASLVADLIVDGRSDPALGAIAPARFG